MRGNLFITGIIGLKKEQLRKTWESMFGSGINQNCRYSFLTHYLPQGVGKWGIWNCIPNISRNMASKYGKKLYGKYGKKLGKY